MEYLTKAEARVFDHLPSGTFSIDEVSQGRATRYVQELLNRLVLKRRLIRLKRGVFAKGNSNADRLNMALALAPTGYIGLSSALKLYGLLDEELSRVYVVTEKKSGVVDLGSFDVQRVPMHGDFYGESMKEGVWCSTLAKTFFDCLKKPQYAGGIQKVLLALKLASLSKTNWQELLYYLEHTGSKSFKQKVGFWLNDVAPTWFLARLDHCVGKKVIVRIGSSSATSFDPRWRVYHGSDS